MIVGLKAQLSTDSASSKQLPSNYFFFGGKQGKFLVFHSFQAENRFRARLNWIVFVSLFTKIYSTVLVQIKFEIEILQTSPHKGLEPFTVGLKVQRSTD